MKLPGNPTRNIQGIACTEKRVPNAKITEMINDKITSIAKFEFLKNDILPRNTIDSIKFETKIEKMNLDIMINLDT